jgi:TolB-like protein
MGEQPIQRRLAAILAADVAGYTRLMEQDTDGTVAAWQAARREVIKPTVADHSGKIVKLTGDGFLVEFLTVQDAVNCAIAMQRDLASSSLDFRMGVNMGDIVDDGEDIHGEGVNIAARLEGLAETGGICISGDVYNQIRNRVDAIFEDMGQQEVKNVSAPVQVYAVRLEGSSAPSASATPAAPAISDKPSIAVLAFDNMSGDPEQEYFADGVTEDIITALSAVRSFFVIARNSSFAYKGRAVDVKTIGRELGVQYVLEGSVRKGGNRIRVTAQLIGAATMSGPTGSTERRTTYSIYKMRSRPAWSVPSSPS